MGRERIVFAHEIEPGHGVRVLASGEVDESMLEVLELYIELQKKRLKCQQSSPDSVSSEQAPEESGGKAQVSFFITNAQKAALRKQGYSNEQIAKMHPEDAHRLLKVV